MNPITKDDILGNPTYLIEATTSGFVVAHRNYFRAGGSCLAVGGTLEEAVDKATAEINRGNALAAARAAAVKARQDQIPEENR